MNHKLQRFGLYKGGYCTNREQQGAKKLYVNKGWIASENATLQIAAMRLLSFQRASKDESSLT